MAVNRFFIKFQQLYAELSKEEREIFHEWESRIDRKLSCFKLNHDEYVGFGYFSLEEKKELEKLSDKVISILSLVYKENGWKIEFHFKKIKSPFIGYEDGPLQTISIR